MHRSPDCDPISVDPRPSMGATPVTATRLSDIDFHHCHDISACRCKCDPNFPTNRDPNHLP
jgi:hypothetical protein